MESNDRSINDPKVVLTKNDLEQIRSYAIEYYNKHDSHKLKMDDSQFRTYCYVQATQAWLRTRNLLKIILD